MVNYVQKNPKSAFSCSLTEGNCKIIPILSELLLKKCTEKRNRKDDICKGCYWNQ